MKPTELREITDLETIFATKSDWEDMRDNSAYLRMVQSLYMELDSAYKAIVYQCTNNDQTCEIRGRIKALEEVLGIVHTKSSTDSVSAQALEAMDVFVDKMEQLKEKKDV